MKAFELAGVAIDFSLGSSEAITDLEYHHLVLEEEVISYLASLPPTVQTAGLEQLDPYGYKVWTPEETLEMERRLEQLEVDLQSLYPWGTVSDYEPPEMVGLLDGRPCSFHREGMFAFLFRLRRVFEEARRRGLYVHGVGD